MFYILALSGKIIELYNIIPIFSNNTLILANLSGQQSFCNMHQFISFLPKRWKLTNHSFF